MDVPETGGTGQRMSYFPWGRAGLYMGNEMQSDVGAVQYSDPFYLKVSFGL